MGWQAVQYRWRVSSVGGGAVVRLDAWLKLAASASQLSPSGGIFLQLLAILGPPRLRRWARRGAKRWHVQM